MMCNLSCPNGNLTNVTVHQNLCNACYVRWRVKCERAERGSARPTAQQIASTARMMQTPPIAWTASQPMSPSNGATSMQMGRLATAQRNGYPSRVQTSPSVTTFPPQNMTWSPYLTANPAAGLGSYYSTVREGQDIAFFVNGNGSPIETADPAQLMNVMPGFNPAQTRAQRKGSSASEYSLESPVGTTRNKGRGSQSPSNKRKAASPTGHSNKRNK